MASNPERRGGSWRIVWRYEGKKQYTSWETLEKAWQAKAIVEAFRSRVTDAKVYAEMGVEVAGDSDSPAEPIAAGPVFREWCTEWLPSKTNLTPGTRHRYERQLETRLYPTFGDTPLTTITTVMIGRWINEMRALGYSPATVTRYYSLLHTALEAAVRDRKIEWNPCPDDFVRDEGAYELHDSDDDEDGVRQHYMTPVEFERLRAQFAGEWHPLLDTFADTGIRWSEATALAAKHLVAPTTRKGPQLRVWRAWKGAATGRYLGAPKGRQRRTVPISVDLYQTLKRLVDGQPPDTLVFRQESGAELDYDAMYDKVWVPAMLVAGRCPDHPPVGEGRQLPGARGWCRDYGGQTWKGRPCGARVVNDTNRCSFHAGPPPRALSACDCPGVLHHWITWHGLRHMHAAWLLSDPRMTVIAVSRRLGHADPSTTSRIYGGLLPEAEEVAVDAIADARRAGREATQ